MVLSVTPPPPVSAVRGAGTSASGTVAADPASAAALAAGTSAQPTTVINAKVQQIVAENLVQVAIGNLLLELASDIPLQVGQTVQLAVSQTDQGVRLAIVSTTDPTAPTVVDIAAPLNPAVAPAGDRLTGLERLAVSIATEQAATQQSGQGQLFADLNAVAGAPDLPPALRAAIAQVLVQQTSLDANLTGEDVRKAFQGSGLLLEASLASGTAIPAPDRTGPDLKAALIVLRQALTSVLQTSDDAAPAPAAGPTTYAPTTSAMPQPALTFDPASGEPVVSAPSLAPEIDGEATSQMPAAQTLLGRLQVAEHETVSTSTTAVLSSLLTQAKPQSLTPSAVLTLLQEAQQQVPRAAGLPIPRPAIQDGGRGDVVIRTNTPPPPFRGNLPTPQAIASPSLRPEMPLPAIAHRLLEDTDAALARQTLLQVASLPDRTDATTARVDPTAPRWNFEIPFLTQQGTAMAQFEISRDGGGTEPERDPAKRVWRARFSLDVEPAGPVHALITYNRERTSVRMWAERPATAAQLRAGVTDLSQALSRAELPPADIVVQLGAPPSAAPPRAGHFLDRAL
jgi:Flagellar hook-length control protein FliK